MYANRSAKVFLRSFKYGKTAWKHERIVRKYGYGEAQSQPFVIVCLYWVFIMEMWFRDYNTGWKEDAKMNYNQKTVSFQCDKIQK